MIPISELPDGAISEVLKHLPKSAIAMLRMTSAFWRDKIPAEGSAIALRYVVQSRALMDWAIKNAPRKLGHESTMQKMFLCVAETGDLDLLAGRAKNDIRNGSSPEVAYAIGRRGGFPLLHRAHEIGISLTFDFYPYIGLVGAEEGDHFPKVQMRTNECMRMAWWRVAASLGRMDALELLSKIDKNLFECAFNDVVLHAARSNNLGVVHWVLDQTERWKAEEQWSVDPYDVVFDPKVFIPLLQGNAPLELMQRMVCEGYTVSELHTKHKVDLVGFAITCGRSDFETWLLGFEEIKKAWDRVSDAR